MVMRSWRNRHTRTFEGRVGDRTGSSPVDRTSSARKFWYKACVQLFVYWDEWLCRNELIRREFGSFLHNSSPYLQYCSSLASLLPFRSGLFFPQNIPFTIGIPPITGFRWQALTSVDVCWLVWTSVDGCSKRAGIYNEKSCDWVHSWRPKVSCP